MGIVLEALKEEIDKTIRSLDIKEFEADPIAGKHFSRITSVMSSAYKRHGTIIERSLLEAVKLYDRYEAWREEQFFVPESVDHIIDGNLGETGRLAGIEHPYGTGPRTLQVDLIVVDKTNNSVAAYEVKRGFGWFDAGKRRSMLRDTLAVQLLVKGYAQGRGFTPSSASSYVVFYYGKASLPKPFSLIGAELDGHFGCEVRSHIEEVNAYFQQRLFAILSGGA